MISEIAKFREKYPGIFITSIENDDSVKWYHFEDLSAFSAFVVADVYLTDDMIDLFYKEYTEDVVELEMVEKSPIYEEFCKREDRLLLALARNTQEIKIIYVDKLSEEEWLALQDEKSWLSQITFQYWSRLINNDFEALMKIVGLSVTEFAFILAILPNTCEQWIENGAPLAIINTLVRLDLKIEQEVQKWLADFAEQKKISYAGRNYFGIPNYACSKDYYSCESSLVSQLPELALYRTFISRVIDALNSTNIQTEDVLIGQEDYYAWLDENDFESSPMASLAFATQTLNFRRN